MSERCNCETAGYCERRGRQIGTTLFKLCSSGPAGVAAVDRVFANRPRPPKPIRNAKKISLVGSTLLTLMESATGQALRCGDCKSFIRGLDLSTVHDQPAIVARLVADCPIPQQIRDVYPTREQQAEWITPIVAQAVSNAPPFPPPRKRHDGRRWPAIQPIDLSTSVRHIVYHLWPIASQDAWEWNLEQLAARWMLFNGTKAISIAVDRETVSADAVIEFCRRRGLVWDAVIVGPNDPKIGEVAYWQQKLNALPPAEPNHVVFYGHGKGVRQRTNTRAVRLWTQLMYEANLDYWPVTRSLLEAHLMSGCLRRFGAYREPGNFRWHYSGTFYWFRWADIQARRPDIITRKYTGSESWPGAKARPAEAGVIFADRENFHMYDEGTALGVWSMWDQWKKQNHHNRTEDAMCSTWGVNFARYLPAGSVEGKIVVEVGAADIYGSCRPLIMQRGPASYVSTDMQPGVGVDLVCSGTALPERIGKESADVIICTEVLEHVKEWREFVVAIWSVLRPGGILLLTTRSPGFPYHEYPSDHWRWTQDHMHIIFYDQQILTLTDDPTTDPGVGVIVRKQSETLGVNCCDAYEMEQP